MKQISRRRLLGGVVGVGVSAGGLVLVASCGLALPSERLSAARIGYLSAGDADASPTNMAAFRDGMREIGWVDGVDIVIEPRYADGHDERMHDLAGELIRLQPDVLLVNNT